MPLTVPPSASELLAADFPKRRSFLTADSPMGGGAAIAAAPASQAAVGASAGMASVAAGRGGVGVASVAA